LNIVLKRRVPRTAKNLLTRWATISFSWTTLLHIVNISE
jgi:hypothetical protein